LLHLSFLPATRRQIEMAKVCRRFIISSRYIHRSPRPPAPAPNGAAASASSLPRPRSIFCVSDRVWDHEDCSALDCQTAHWGSSASLTGECDPDATEDGEGNSDCVAASWSEPLVDHGQQLEEES
jgi:hypothetical protein